MAGETTQEQQNEKPSENKIRDVKSLISKIASLLARAAAGDQQALSA